MKELIDNQPVFLLICLPIVNHIMMPCAHKDPADKPNRNGLHMNYHIHRSRQRHHKRPTESVHGKCNLVVILVHWIWVILLPPGLLLHLGKDALKIIIIDDMHEQHAR